MFVNAAFALSLLSATYALTIGRRDDQPSDADLLASCPGGPGSSVVEKADRCTLINIANNPYIRVWNVLGDPQLNCGGGTEDIVVTLGGSTTVEQTTEVNADLGVDLDGISIGGGVSTSSSTSSTESQTIQYNIPPGQQAVYVAGIEHTSQTGNIQVNYGDRQFGHFIWFTGATVTQLTPNTNDVEYTVLQTACGTDPRDVSSLPQ
ncbi:hypothetical protein BD309DRAFT_991203 [Dichomitus squalens]|nr:hypothetical protein BD309DRAFT_991203 [Dichomitus squalens]